MANKLQKLIAEFERANGKIQRRAYEKLIEIITVDDTAASIAKKVKKVYADLGIGTKTEQAMADSITTTLQVGAGLKGASGVKVVRRWYLEHAYSAEKVKIKTLISKAVDTKQVTEDIRASIKAMSSWRKAAQDLSDRKILKADVAKDVQNIIDKARGVYGMSQDTEAYREYQKAIRHVQYRINRLTDQDTSKLRRAYQDILDITNRSSTAQVESAIKYASYFKQRYNAERIARTEMARAYGDAHFSAAAYDDDVIGVEWQLSDAHDIFDICNLNASADFYGMGKGIYPKDHAPEYPAHPNCACSLGNVYRDDTKEASASDYNKRAGQKYIDSLSEQKRRELLGVSGADKYADNPKTWDKNVKNWNGHEDKKPTIPEDVLYGK